MIQHRFYAPKGGQGTTVVAEPYDPEPAELIRRWLTQVGAS